MSDQHERTPQRGLRAALLVLVVLTAQACATVPAPCPVVGPAPGKVGVAVGPTTTETLDLSGTTHTVPHTTTAAKFVVFSVVSTGTPTGAWTIEYSADGVTWDTYNPTGMTLPPNASGSGQTFAIPLDFYEPPFVRLTYTRTSGTGAATVLTTLKD